MSTSHPHPNNQKDVQTTTTLPRITVQHDISTVIEDVRDGIVTVGWEDVWVSCYLDGRPSVHGKVRISRTPGGGGGGGVSFEARDGIEWRGMSTAAFQIACPLLNIPPTPIRLPKHVYTSPPEHPLPGKKITAFDVSPDGTLYATGHADGSIVISPTGLTPNATNTPTTTTTTTTAAATSTSRRRVKGTPHLSTVLSLHFFPSSTVLLSSSSDLSIRIHDANLSTLSDTPIIHPINTVRTHPLNTVRTFQAHASAVTSTAILDRGRNVLSFGRDGTVRLWDVAGAKEIVGRRWRVPGGTSVLCGCVGEMWEGPDPPVIKGEEGGGEEVSRVTTLDGEVGTVGKVVFVGLQDGSVRGYELSTGHPRFFSSALHPSSSSSSTSSNSNSKAAPIDSIAYSAETGGAGVLVSGRRDGVIMVWDLASDPPASTLAIAVSAGVVQEDEYDWRPTSIFKRNGAGIESLAFSPAPGPNGTPSSTSSSTLSPRFPSILVGAEDGLFCRIGIDANGGPVLLEEFVGVEAGDGVRAVRGLVLDGREVDWSAGDDGFVRRY